jgi:colanic acid/amylovoran biosynthesis glycosyltransferase
MTSPGHDGATPALSRPAPVEVVARGEAGRSAHGKLPTVVVYSHSLLEPSMTFIRSHAEALATYRPVYAGAHRVHGLGLPEDRVVTANRGGWLGSAEEFLFRRFGIAGRLAGGLRKFEPGIVHAHFGQSGPAALALAEALRVPLVVTFHGNDATITAEEARRTWRGREYLRGKGRVIERAALFIAVSEFIRSRLLAQGYPAGKVVTHHNGIDVDYFTNVPQRREPVVLFVGRFVEKKGCEYLLRALGQLAAQGRPVRGVLLGDGPLRPELERVAAESGAQVEFKGFLPLPEVREWLGRASLVAVPSVTAANGDSEGLPTVILEAQAMGTPVVATRHAGNAEGVAEGRSARLVDERDVAGLADAIRFFMDSPQAVERFGAAGRAFVEAHFSIASQVAGLERIYDRARMRAAPSSELHDAA